MDTDGSIVFITFFSWPLVGTIWSTLIIIIIIVVLVPIKPRALVLTLEEMHLSLVSLKKKNMGDRGLGATVSPREQL